MKKNNIFKAIAVILSLLFSSTAFSQKRLPLPWPASPKKDNLKGDTVKKDTSKKLPVVLPGPVKPYKDVVTKAFTSKTGLFTVHLSPAVVYFEIPDSILNRDIMVINRITKAPAGYGMFPGEELDEKTIRFEKGKDSTIRIRYQLVINEADSSNAIYKAVVNSSLNPLVQSLPIKAFGKNSYVIDVTTLVKGNSFINSIDANTSLGKSLVTINMQNFVIESVHAYPINVELCVSKTAASTKAVAGMAAGSPVSIETNSSFIELPKVPMQRRLFDERVGFFADYANTFSDDQQKAEQRQFILRWRLEPRDQDIAKWKRGELVEPKKPIVIYIDPAAPKQWVPYLIQGIDDWQAAFEQAGFKNAIVGVEWPVNDTTMHMDDARYSMLNYFPSETANAYGPNVHDPRSGEIIQTHIGWYHNVMELLHNWYFTQAAVVDPKARKAKFDDELMGQLIRFVSSHEVGHTLGLRHNFGSSSKTPVDSLRNRHYLEVHGHTASIMDYARFNYVAQPEDNIPENDLFPHIGEYDKWAIEWGYKNSGATDENGDKKIVQQWIVQRTGKNPRLWFGNGETRRFDPRCQTEDLGDDAMKAGMYGIRNLKRLVPNIPAWAHENGGTYNAVGEAYSNVQQQYFRYMAHVLKNVAGVTYDIKSEEEPGISIQPVSIAKQKEALRFFNAELFRTPFWLMNETIIDNISVPQTGNTITHEELSAGDFIEDTQSKVLNSLLDVKRLNKIEENENQFGSKVFPLSEYLATIHNGIWGELETSTMVKVDVHRRNLQKCYFGAMLAIMVAKDAPSTENDISSLVKADIVRLKSEIQSAIPRTKDTLTLYHLKDMLSRIKNALTSKGA